MRILVLGTGGVGGYFGARLAADGNDVIFVARGAHAEAMRTQGLRVLSANGDLHLERVQLHEDRARTGLVDIVLVAVKMYDLEAAAETLRPLLQIDTAVVPLQNGVEAAAILERKLGRRYVCGGVAYIAAGIEAPGVIRHTGTMARLVFGERQKNESWRLETLEAACRGAGIDAVLTDAIEREVWKKFVFLAPFAAITCLGRTTIGAVREDPVLWPRFVAMVEEAVAVARARGIALPEDIVDERLQLARGLPTTMKSSMLLDLEAGRRLELDWLTGAVLRLGEEAGIATPASREAYEALAPWRAGRTGT
ncbi:ketopantoate reductase family protein [Benzoatithermus flavus]|uniref:2-dehydropantoate 2-reductase n=1 Tax=Benzoatithermus flavus TaxID=3108223 RepID=A0ABU8XS75_9PROT